MLPSKRRPLAHADMWLSSGWELVEENESDDGGGRRMVKDKPDKQNKNSGGNKNLCCK